MKENRAIAVIGSNSFSGSHFVDYALNQGATVWGISRSEEQNELFAPYRNNLFKDRFSFFQLDLNKDFDSIVTLLGDLKPEFVVNFAAQGMVAQSWRHPLHWYQTNTLSNVKLHDQLRKFDFLKRYIHISTPEVYGTCSGMIDEKTPFNPSTPYAVSRAAADMSLLSFYSNYNFPVVFTRAANVYGWGQQLYRIIPRTILSILSGKVLPLDGGGHSVRSFIHISDVCKGTWLAMTQGQPGAAYHLSTKDVISIKQLVETICDMMHVSFGNVVEIVGERPGKDHAYLLKCERAKRELGWEPCMNLEDGLKDCIAWARGNVGKLEQMSLEYIHKE